MKPEDKNRIDVLEKQVQELMAFMKQKKENQLSFPLDYATQQILENGVPIVTGLQIAGAIPTGSGYFTVKVNNKPIKVMYIN